MKLTKLFLYGQQRIGRDGTTGSVRLAAVQLDDGRYVGVDGPKGEDYGKVGTETDEHGWPLCTGDELSQDENAHNEYGEFGEFEGLCANLSFEASWSDNPVVYGPDDTEFEVLGVKVQVHDVQQCEVEDRDNPDLWCGPLEVDLTAEPELVFTTLEPNSHNSDGSTVVLYFDGVPSEAQVRRVCESGLQGLNLGVDTADPFFSFEEHSTPVSERAKLHRYEVYPAG